VSDLVTPNTLRVRFVRCTSAHADIISIDTADASSMPGIKAVMMEALAEDLVIVDGQIVTTSFMDYAIPSAVEIPSFKLGHMTTPSPIIPGGMKGTGEAGVIGPPAAVIGAIENALGPDDPQFTTMPVTPQMICERLAQANHTETSTK